jgi:serine/threonine protein kinase
MDGQYNPGDIVLGNWKLIQQIGEGGFGKVFEAEREDFGTVYRAAIKIITIPHSKAEIANARAEGMDQASITAYFRSFVEEVVREFALMSELKGTANIVSYEDHSVVQHNEGIGWDIIIRMELLTPLLQYSTEGDFTRHDAMKLGIDMCRALELCQRFNIVHRDIKPENILVSKLGDFKLGDFGIARTVEKTTSGLSKKGTYTYMAPEIYRGGAYGSGVDIYSLGIVLYRLLNDNRAPFLPDYPAPISHSDREEAFAKRISGAALPEPKNADGRLAEIVLKACAYDPKDRYTSPMLMRQELDAILYNRAQAQIIYPDGDAAPIKSVEYVEPPTSPEPDETLTMQEDLEGLLQSDADWAGEPDEDYFDGDTIYSAGDYVFFGKYNGSPIKWVVYFCHSKYCRLLCAEALYVSGFNSSWEESEIRHELNSKLFFESFTPEQQKVFLPYNGSTLTIASTKDYAVMKRYLKKRHLKAGEDSWLREGTHYMSMYGWTDELDFLDSELMFGVRPICEVDISAFEIVGGSGDKDDPFELESRA